MHFLSLLIASYIFIPIAYSQFGLFFSESLGPDPSLYSAFDPTLHLEESRVGDASSPYPMTELNSDLFSDQNSEPYQTTQPAPNLFLDEDVTLNPMLDSEPSFFLSNNIFCDDYNDNANANDFEFFGKFRRRDSCSSLGMGEDVPSGGSNQEPQFDLEKLIQFLQRPIPVFEASPDICPARMYGSSNTPVCDVPDITNTAVTPSQPESYLLENVYSGVFDFMFCIRSQEAC